MTFPPVALEFIDVNRHVNHWEVVSGAHGVVVVEQCQQQFMGIA
jgi:hypothetical protein